MTLDVQFRKNTLFVNKKPINFDFEIGNALAVDDKVIFLLKIPYDDNAVIVGVKGFRKRKGFRIKSGNFFIRYGYGF